ncbi:MAG: ABC transporter ATP-binding protein [Phycisphaerales bacterium]|nr:ABC transporter ATP-binding protein [Phycisphaerales bacterium]
MIPADWRLSAESLHLRRGRRDVLTDVSLALRPGECVSIIGPNGCGKTTLLLALLGLLTPQRGHVRLSGREMHRLPARLRGRFAALVPQGGPAPTAFRVADVVAAGRFPHVPALRAMSAADERAVQSAMERCGIAALADRPIDAVSAGERQNAMMAAALAQDPQLLLLDEPDTALDPGRQIELLTRLREWRAAGRALVLVSHDLHLPAHLGGRCIGMRGGRVVIDGTTEEVLRGEALRGVFDAEFQEVTDAAGRRLVLPRW